MTKRPIIGVTMGDPCGNGPEITIKALSDPELYRKCRPIVIGDAACMQYALETAERIGVVKKGTLAVHLVHSVDEALFTFGSIDVYDLGIVTDISDRKFGIACPLGGEAAFQYVKKVIELAMEGQVDATVTNALSKEANELLPAGDREENIPCDLNNTEWFRKIDSSNGAVFFASGVFYYFLTEQVRALVQGMADSFPGSVLVFDAANRTAVKMIAKTWLKSAKIKDVGAYFAVSDAVKEISAWDSRLQVSSRGYMLGYNDLKDPSVSGFFRFLARVGDGVMKMQIVRIKFVGR